MDFSFLNKIQQDTKYSDVVNKKADLFKNNLVVANPFNENELRIEGKDRFYTVQIKNKQAIKCDCEARRNCYHMAIADNYLKEEHACTT